MHSIVINGADNTSAGKAHLWPLFLIATLLLSTGGCVLLSWHAPHLLTSIYPYTTLMAYNTALAFIACGLGLIAIVKMESILLSMCSFILFIIATLTLLDLTTGIELNTTDWFVILLNEPPVRSQPISPSTSSVLLLASLALWFSRHTQGNYTLVTAMLCILMIFITLSAVISQGVGTLPAFVWFGIKMAPQTAIGLLAFAGAILSLRYRAAINAFNWLSVFSRLTTGFFFMSLLFIGIGSIGLMQINKVAAISQKLYDEPVQINNAVLQIRTYAMRLNRTIKDITVNQALIHEHNIPKLVDDTQKNINRSLDIIQRDATHDMYTDQIRLQFSQWRYIILDNYTKLQAGDIDSYRQTAVTLSQEKTLIIEALCDSILQQAQKQVLQLNEEAVNTKSHAGNLMLVVLCGFLLMGMLVSGLITRSLNWQLEKIRHAMLALANGNTQAVIPFHDHPHEIGEMAQTLKVFARNIDERNKAMRLIEQHQQKLEKSNHLLAQTNKELETFAYVASHDLKSPLRGISQLSSWIDEDLEAKEFNEVEKHTRMLRNRIHRMEKLLDDLLIFYRAGKTNGAITTIDVAHIAKELFEIQNTKPGLRLKLGDELPVFETLGTPFEQILRNLFSNAIKHHDRDDGIIRIEAQRISTDFYEFRVRDDGPGIPEKFQARVFGMFQTLKSRDEQEGSGMGLALIKKIVETYGGSIRVFSNGRGCQFTFSWPAHVSKRKQSHD